MEFSGMSKTSDDTFSYLSSSATAHPSLYKTLRYSPNNDFADKDLSHASHDDQVLRLVDAFHCPYNNNLRECESPQVSMVSAMCNRVVSPDTFSDFVDKSSEFGQAESLSETEKSTVPDKDDIVSVSKYPDLNEKSYPCVVHKVAADSASPSSNVVSDIVCIPSPCNGSLSRPGSNSDLSPHIEKSEAVKDVNGCCRPTDTPPLHDQERVKMDLDKLDETIDYVLSFARSDEPCEGMFVLSCRAREFAVTSSPNLRANTPSSGLITSPTISPAPSPHSNNLNSPILQTCKAQTALQSNNSCNIVSQQSMQRYIVDQTHGIIQLSSNSPQRVSAHYGNQGVSFVQLCPDSSTNPVLQVTQHHIVSQIGQTLTTTAAHVLFHPNVLHSFQNHTGQPAQFTLPHSTLSTAPIQRIRTPILSPVKANIVQTTNQINKTSLSSDANATPYSMPNHVPEGANPSFPNPVSINPSNICVVQTPMQSTQSLLGGTLNTSVPMGAMDDAKCSLAVSASGDKKCVQANTSVTFRHPIIPANSSISLIPVSSVGVTSNHTLTTTSNINTTFCQSTTGISRKRSHSSVPGSNKRRKTVGSPPFPVNSINKNPTTQEACVRSTNSGAQEHIEKLKGVDLKLLVSAPTLQPFSSVLPPSGMCDSASTVATEDVFLQMRGLKYLRGPMSLKLPKCIDSTTSSKVVDSYLTQHLKLILPHSLNVYHPKIRNLPSVECNSVRASPEPPSFENNMKALFSRMNQFSKQHSKDIYDEKVSYECNKLSGESLTPQSLLHMFSHNPSNSLERTEADRCTPPLALYHMPNPRLLCQPIHLAPCVERSFQSVCSSISDSNVSDVKLENNLSGISNVSNSVTKEVSLSGDSHARSQFVDLETGETMIMPHSKPTEKSFDSTLTENDKLHITFTVNPSTVNISKIIHRISELLNVEESSIDFQITRSGAQITLDQNQSQSEVVMRSLETHLRQQFTPLSLHFEKDSSKNEVCQEVRSSHLMQCNVLESSPSLRHPSSNIPQSNLCKMECDASGKTDCGLSSTQEACRYTEETVSVNSLVASRHRSVKSCKGCGKAVSPNVQRKWLDDLSTITGITMSLENSVDFVFCSNDCLYSFARVLASHHNRCLDTIPDHSAQSDLLNSNGYNFDQQRQLIMTDFPCSMPILLQSSLSKSKSSNLKRQHSQQSVSNKKRSANASGPQSKLRKWQGIRWRSYSSENNHSFDLSSRCVSENDITSTMKANLAVMRASHSDDKRVCVLCQQAGDAPEDGPGRLLPLDVNNWIHINCALWCYEVYETVGGSLNNLDVWLAKAKETNCSHCGLTGAGLPCYNPKCSCVYHVPCAIKIRCMFFTDRGMYCPQHQTKEFHPMQLSSLVVSRRVYISRDENSQVARVVHEDNDKHVVRIGGVSLHSVGQLLPHQIDSGNFHNLRNIYPTGMCATRIYWSMRRPRARAKYVCEILEKDCHPFFRITAVDKGMEDVSVTHETCDGAWQIILSRIESLFKEHKLVRVFPQLLKGEDLFGLNESHIVRAIESLPGVDGLRDYVFNFGRLELISEMPLAINPSGCARSEPKMQTYLKRLHDSGEFSSPSSHRTGILPGVRRLPHSGFCGLSYNNMDSTISKQYQSNRFQQYRKLKSEAKSNVTLGRSRIQGLGLFAARDLESQTMVIEYIGELIRLEVANRREKQYEARNKGIYMFRLDEDTVIDATVCGGLARYINHSCQPNCYAEHLNFGDHSHIVIITNRRIKKGEELSYDNNFDLEDRSDKIPCLCRAPNCRKWMN